MYETGLTANFLYSQVTLKDAARRQVVAAAPPLKRQTEQRVSVVVEYFLAWVIDCRQIVLQFKSKLGRYSGVETSCDES